MPTREPTEEPTKQDTQEWWEQDGLPWNSKPTKQDYWCLGWFGFVGLFGLAMIPLRAWLLGLDPPVMLALTGSRIGAASTGALQAVGQADNWLFYLLVGSVMAIKFDWIYWWAGKLWGRGMLEVQAGRSKRSARNIARAEAWALKLGWLGIFLAYVPIPLPIALVVFVLAGTAGMPLWKFMVLNFVAKTLWSLGYFALGMVIGEPVVYVLEQYARVANWVAIALLVVIFVGAFKGQSKRQPSQ
ncbi:SNARE associated Golgi protein [Corynebacterium capitovis DSM 44611]|uniref:DedA family protein n=1 Tax=Corynebacterium capitovis TaxID=131081 RepID=UPI0003616E8F|nr:VTT domain-containing protein [Corynebacterium capitovis]WKD56789.1 SNARE associated Golgi protein [Corynebacterium capitovis DSM 44611]